ncbi:unnamed protein product [Camellia sinensis]
MATTAKASSAAVFISIRPPPLDLNLTSRQRRSENGSGVPPSQGQVGGRRGHKYRPMVAHDHNCVVLESSLSILDLLSLLFSPITKSPLKEEIGRATTMMTTVRAIIAGV